MVLRAVLCLWEKFKLRAIARASAYYKVKACETHIIWPYIILKVVRVYALGTQPRNAMHKEDDGKKKKGKEKKKKKRMCAGYVNDSVRKTNRISGRLCEHKLIAMTMNALVRLLVVCVQRSSETIRKNLQMQNRRTTIFSSRFAGRHSQPYRATWRWSSSRAVCVCVCVSARGSAVEK